MAIVVSVNSAAQVEAVKQILSKILSNNLLLVTTLINYYYGFTLKEIA